MVLGGVYFSWGEKESTLEGKGQGTRDQGRERWGRDHIFISSDRSSPNRRTWRWGNRFWGRDFRARSPLLLRLESDGSADRRGLGRRRRGCASLFGFDKPGHRRTS